MSDIELKRCPCGKVPIDLLISDTNCKWYTVTGDCCGEWSIEFRSGYLGANTPECKALAIEAWNDAPRISEGIRIALEAMRK